LFIWVSFAADGRAYFSCPGLFTASFSLTGAQKVEEEDSEEVKLEKIQSGKLGGSWYLVEMAFSFNMAENEDGPDEELRKGEFGFFLYSLHFCSIGKSLDANES